MSSEGFLLVFFVLVVLAAIDIVRRAVFAILRERRQRKLQEAIRRLRRPSQPHVSVLVYAHKSTDAVEATLDSLRRSQYGAFDVVVVNGVLNKKEYSSQTRLDVALLQRRITGSRMDAYRAAYRKSRHGKVVLCVNAGDILDPLCVKRAVIALDNHEQGRIPVEREMKHKGVSGVASLLRGLLQDSPLFVRAYRRRALRHAKNTGRINKFLWGLVRVSWEVTLVGVVVASFVLGPLMLWYVWIVFSAYLLALIWLKGEWRISQKLAPSFAVPSALFLLPIASFVEAAFQLGARK